MTSQKDRERELRKNKLRRNMTVNRDWEEQAAQEEQKKTGFLSNRMRIILIGVLAVMLIVGFVLYRYVKENRAYTTVQEVWAVEMKDTNFSSFTEMGSGLVRYSRDGAAYFNKAGEMVWNQAFEMADPVVSVNGTWMAIADRGSYYLYIFDEKGTTGQTKTTLPISKVAVSGNGVAATIQEDAAANYINLFDRTGKELDIEVKSLLSGDGYPVDLSLSDAGTILMASFAYLEQGMMKNKIVFYNFSEAGKNMVQRIVGGFQHYEDALVPDVEMLGQKAAVAFADDRISFYSLKNEVSPELVNEVELTQDVLSVCYSEEYVGVMLASETNAGAKELVVYNSKGQEAFRKETDFPYRTVAITGSHVIAYHETACEIYSMNGQLRYAGALSGTISRLDNLDGVWFQIGGEEMKKLQFQ